MRPRADVLLTVGVLTVVFTAIFVFRVRQDVAAEVGYPATFMTDPPGAQALFEATRMMGVGARRYHGRTTRMEEVRVPERRQLFAILEPATLAPAERAAIVRYSERGDILLAGSQSSMARLMNCFGYDVTRSGDTLTRTPKGEATFTELLHLDSVRVAPPGAEVSTASPWVRTVLSRSFERTVVDSSRANDAGVLTCTVPANMRVDTLLLTTRQQPAALRLQRAEGGPVVILVSDVSLFRNRSLRSSDAGIFALGLFVGHYDEVIFEEAHHGGDASGSLGDVLLSWSRESPWGWFAWQLAIVGVIALLFGAFRFGPVRTGIIRTRRSSLEHVNALATALSAAKGHDEAIAAIVRGLRRRMVPSGQRSRSDWRSWLQDFSRHPGNRRSAVLLDELVSLTQPGQPSASVRRAALLVEDLWQQLRP